MSKCRQCGDAHEFYTVNCKPVTFPKFIADVMHGEVVLIPPHKRGRYIQAQPKQ